MDINEIMHLVARHEYIVYIHEAGGGLCEASWDKRGNEPVLLTSEGTSITGFVDVLDVLKEMEIVSVMPRPKPPQTIVDMIVDSTRRKRAMWDAAWKSAEDAYDTLPKPGWSVDSKA